MMTPFNLIQSLRSWFFARDGDIVLQDGRAIKISNADITITTGGIIITGGTVTIDGSAVSVAGHAHSVTHASTTGQTVDDHHTEAHTLASHSGQLSHDTDLSDVSTDDHHAQAHTVASHSDTTGTGTELNTLTDGSDAGSLHVHDVAYHLKTTFSDTTGTTSKPLKTDTGGLLHIEGLGAGVAPAANRIHAVGEIRGGGLVCGATNVSSGTGRLMIAEISTPGTPASGFAYIWVDTSGDLNFKNDAGTNTNLTSP